MKHDAMLRRILDPLYAKECENERHEARTRERAETELIPPALEEFEALVDAALASGMTEEQVEQMCRDMLSDDNNVD